MLGDPGMISRSSVLLNMPSGSRLRWHLALIFLLRFNFLDFENLDFRVCVHMVEDDKPEYSECREDWSVSNCFLVDVWATKRVPGENWEEKEI